MLVKTDETANRLRPLEVRERTRHEQREAIEEANRADENSVGFLVARDLDSAAVQIGRALHITDVQKRLKCICPNIHFEVARMDPDLMGVYLIRRKGWNPTDPDETREFIGRLHRGPWVPEFQVYKSKLIDRPDPTVKGHTRQIPTLDDMLWGWRTTLARLIQKGVITTVDADWAFAHPTIDMPSWQLKTT